MTTFSKTLAARLSQNADVLLGPDAPERARIDIIHLHKLARDTWVNTLKHKLVFIKVKRFNELRKLLLPSRAKGLPSAASGHIIAIVGLLGGRIGIDFILPAFTNWSTALLWTIVLIKLAGKS